MREGPYLGPVCRAAPRVAPEVLARDVTLDELRIECFFPADEETTTFCHCLAQGGFSIPNAGPTPIAGPE